MRKKGIAASDTTRVTIFDTIPYPLPVPKDSIVVRYITEKLPVIPDSSNNSAKNIPDSSNIAPGNIPDSAEVEIPITQKVYEDSLYRAYVSGYNPSLDSLIIFPQHDITTITNNYTCPKPRQKRWGIGIHVGYGVTIANTPQFAPYIGFGISYNLINF